MFPFSYRDFLSWPGFTVTLALAWYGLCIPFGIEKVYCTAAWTCLVCGLVFVPTAMRTIGPWGTMSSLAFGLLLYVIGSWIAFLYFPEVGVFKELVSNTDAFERMGGLGHPNELGFYCAFTIIVFTVLGASGRLHWALVFPVILVTAAALVNCFSRTAMLVTMIGVIVSLQNVWRKNFGLTLAVVFVAVAVAFVVIGSGKVDWMIESALKGISKTGGSEDLSSATGRDRIWAYAMEQIKSSPVFGYGYGAARFIMYDYSFHCHNIILNAMLAGGVVAGIILVVQLLYLLWGIFFESRYEVDGLAACILVGGMVESLLTGTTPGAPLVIWVMIIFWRPCGMVLAKPQGSYQTDATESRQDHVGSYAGGSEDRPLMA